MNKPRCALLVFPGLFAAVGLLHFSEAAAQNLTHGPFAGGVTATSARFYVRVEPAGLANIQLATTPDFHESIFGTAVRTDAGKDFTALIAIDNLAANQVYYYQALVEGVAVGEIRRFSTFPPAGAREPFRFTFGSCIGNRRGPNPGQGQVFTVIAQDQPKFFLQIGDWGYPDSTDGAQDPTRVFSADFAHVQATYRVKYDTAYALQHVLRLAPIDYVFDDHDFMNDNASATSYPTDDSLQTIFVSPQARENDLRAYEELFPGYPPANAAGGIWHKFTCGNADFFMLDTRSARNPNLDAFFYNAETDSIEFRPRAGHSMLAGETTFGGENQMNWLLRELRASQADWKFIVSTVPFNRSLEGLIHRSVSLQDSVVFIPGLGTVSLFRVAFEMVDKWVGFPEDQQRLLQFIQDHDLKNVIVLSGDTHSAAIDDGANAGLPELMAGALDQSNSRFVLLLQLFGFDIWNGGGQTRNFNDAYGRVTVFGADSVHLEIVDEFGALVAHRTLLGKSSSSSVQAVQSTAPPRSLALGTSFPNPFRPSAQSPATMIHYKLAERSFVNVSIHDLTGRQVRSFQTVWQAAGRYELPWDGRDEAGAFASSGVYVVRVQLTDLQGKTQMASQKIALVR